MSFVLLVAFGEQGMSEVEGFLCFSHVAGSIPLAFYKMDEYNNIKIDNGLPQGSWLFFNSYKRGSKLNFWRTCFKMISNDKV